MNLAEGSNPQKAFVKRICTFLYYLGLGKFWYEENPQTRTQKKLYQMWVIISNFFVFSIIINEYLAHLRSDLNDKEKNDLVQFTLAHTSISAKIICTYIQKKDILKVLERLLEGTRSVFVSVELDAACKRQAVRLCGAAVGISYITIFIATVDGIKVHFAEGIPVRTEVTYYPSHSDSGIFVNVLRLFIQFHWWFVVTIMAAIDSLCISSLVIVGYKFKVLQVYFNSLGDKIISNAGNKSRTLQAEEFKNDFIVGIKMHDDALWCAKNVQRALGNLYSVQVFESVVLLVMCLIKLVTVERNLIFLLANFAYILCLIILTGAYMLAGGDVTHEAMQVSTAMFHSGWERAGGGGGYGGRGGRLRSLGVLALQRSQVPVHMFAFGIVPLSYSNFISVIRSSYSFFAVMY